MYENDFEYWVYYQLSIAQFQEEKKKRIQKATDLSIQFLNQAETQRSQNQLNKAVNSYFKALDPIKPYLGEELKVTHKSMEIYLGNYIFDGLSDISHTMYLSAVNSQLNVRWGSGVSLSQLKFTVSDSSGSAQQGINVRFAYSEGLIRPRDAVSNISGEVYTEIKNISSKTSLQTIIAEVDFKEMVFEDQRPDDISRLVLSKMYNPSTKIQLLVEAPLLYVKTNSNIYDELGEYFERGCSKSGFSIAKKESDANLSVMITTNSNELGVRDGLYSVSINTRVVVKEMESNKVVYEDLMDQVKGVGNDYKQANQNAIQKIKEDLEDKISPRFYRKYLN